MRLARVDAYTSDAYRGVGVVTGFYSYEQETGTAPPDGWVVLVDFDGVTLSDERPSLTRANDLDVLRWEFVQTSYEIAPQCLPPDQLLEVLDLIGPPPSKHHWIRVETGRAPRWVDSRIPEPVEVP